MICTLGELSNVTDRAQRCSKLLHSKFDLGNSAKLAQASLEGLIVPHIHLQVVRAEVLEVLSNQLLKHLGTSSDSANVFQPCRLGQVGNGPLAHRSPNPGSGGPDFAAPPSTDVDQMSDLGQIGQLSDRDDRQRIQTQLTQTLLAAGELDARHGERGQRQDGRQRAEPGAEDSDDGDD